MRQLEQTELQTPRFMVAPQTSKLTFNQDTELCSGLFTCGTRYKQTECQCPFTLQKLLKNKIGFKSFVLFSKTLFENCSYKILYWSVCCVSSHIVFVDVSRSNKHRLLLPSIIHLLYLVCVCMTSRVSQTNNYKKKPKKICLNQSCTTKI